MSAIGIVKSLRLHWRRAAVAVVAVVVSAAAVFEAVRWYDIWSTSERLPTQLELPKPRNPAPEAPDILHLNGIPMRPADRRHLSDGHFTIVVKMSDLTHECRDIIESSFLTHSGSAAPKELVKCHLVGQVADPGCAG